MANYDDGLDADGYPIAGRGRQPYRHGYEGDAGDGWQPNVLSGSLASILDRAQAAMSVNPTSDSPIETILGAAIILCFEKGGRPLVLASEPAGATGLLFIPQFKWAIYRSDWAIYNPKTTGALLIECDGKDFHSSASQVAHDSKKDQAAHDRGFLTMRFSGSQIHRNADGCAKKVFDFVYGGKRGAN